MKLGLATLCFTFLIASSYGTKCKNALANKQCKTNMKNNPVYCESPDARLCQRSCDICDNYCYIGDYRNYQGTVNHTVNGVECQRWDSQTPHAHTIGDKPSDFVDGFMPENYCRGFTGDERTEPWCYTTDPNTRVAFCGITKCASRGLRGKVADLEEQLQDLATQHGAQLQNLETQGTNIFFSAVITKQFSLGPKATVVYDTVYGTEGGGYHKDTGLFICAVSGYYQFTVAAFSRDHGVRIDLFQNNEKKFRVDAAPGGPAGVTSGTNTVILLLKSGDVVQVKTDNDSSFRSDLVNTFSGVLLTVV